MTHESVLPLPSVPVRVTVLEPRFEQSQLTGALPLIVDAKKCSVHVSVLRASPYSLEWGAHVYAKVVATNVYGSADASESGDGAMITTYPDPPTALVEDYS